MDIVEEEFFEDAEGYKKRRKIRIGKDEFLEEVTHLECSPQFITEQVNPRIEKSNIQREKEAKREEMNERFEEWKKEKFGK